ncbi:hypothetical protein ACFV3R_03195 [Streptomyces sp. NPDC059740]|uniref:hypothetical protein n=1 Tax=Streptomyces sp. NPDC059740 TaxID=3346926 RepID=UPI00364C14A9
MPSATTRTAALATLVLAVCALTACDPDDAQTSGPQSPSASSSAAGDPAGTPTSSASSPSSASSAPASHAPSQSAIAAGAWINRDDVPMARNYDWPATAQAARTAHDPKFAPETFCGATRVPSLSLSDWKGPAAQAKLAGTGSASDWQARETIVHYPGGSSGAEQSAFALYNGLRDELVGCKDAAPDVHVKITTEGQDGGNRDLAANFAVADPQGATNQVHTYLSLTGPTVTEVVVWATDPGRKWTAPADRTVLKAMETPVCTAFGDCH